MNFAQPLWLLGGFIVCIALSLLIRVLRERRRTTLAKFAGRHLLAGLTRNISNAKRRLKNILVIAAIFICFVALARPQYGFKWIEVKRKGIDILFALDTSRSMLAEDIKPNRLKRAHYAILDFVRQLDGDRVGLMPFAGSAFLMCPLTLDYNAFEQSLSAISSDIIPQGGTDIAAVINTAVSTLNNNANHKILILITDGENLQGDALKAAKEGAEKGLTIYTVGVGTKGGELIPLGTGGFVKDRQGKFVTSKLDEQILSQIAENSGGIYVPLGSSGEGLETIYQEKLSLVPKEELAERRQKVPLERFEYPLAMAIFLLICDFLISERKSKKSLTLPGIKSVSRRIRRNGGLFLLALLLSLGLSAKAQSSEGEQAYGQGDFIAAGEYYAQQLAESPDDPELNYNYGTAAYKNNLFDEAVSSFTKALTSNDVDLQKKAYYNRGNSHYRKGLDMVQGNPQAAEQQWQLALESLQSVLSLAPDDKDAKHNYELIKSKLEELQKRQKQQDKNDQKQDQQKGKEGQKDGQDNGKNKPSDKKQQQQQQQGEKSADTSAKDEQKKPENIEANRQDDKKENGQGQQGADAGTKATEDSAKKDAAARDALRKQLGKMTREEAERLLNGLKNEEGELNFVPIDRGANGNSIEKDW